MQKPNILFIHLGASSFVKEDIRILEEISDLEIFHFGASKSPLNLLLSFIKQFIWLIRKIHSADLIYCWFSDYHAMLPVIFSKIFKIPTIIVLGGFDCNKIEHLNYGIFCSKWRAPIGKYVINNSSLLLPVDETLISTRPISKKWEESHPNGISHNVKGFSTKWIQLPTGYDSTVWEPGPNNRSKVISTVAFCNNHRTALIKGWDLFIEISKLLPEFDFKIIGASEELISELTYKHQPKENLKFSPPKKREDLQEIYQKSSVYLQLSRAEGLPNVLCEAMMCGCVPVGSPVFGIPNAIGDAGFIAETPNPEEIAELIIKAHENADELRIKARNRIIDNFSLNRRMNHLQRFIYLYTVSN